MSYNIKIAKVLCCFNKRTALYLERLNMILTFIGYFLDIFKLCVVPWGATTYTMEFLAVFTFIMLAVNMVLVFLFFSLRLKKMINDNNIKNCIIICYLIISLSILNFFFELLLLCFALDDLYFYTGVYYASSSEVVVTEREWFVGFLTILFSAIIWFINIMLWASEYFRVITKVYGNIEEFITDDIEVEVIKGKNVKEKKNDENENNQKKERIVEVKQNENKDKVDITYT